MDKHNSSPACVKGTIRLPLFPSVFSLAVPRINEQRCRGAEGTSDSELPVRLPGSPPGPGIEYFSNFY